jgi:hypothetical protein
MGKFSSEEIESQYNLIKMLLAEPEKYRDAINAIKKDIAYMPIELKKNLRMKTLSYESPIELSQSLILKNSKWRIS